MNRSLTLFSISESGKIQKREKRRVEIENKKFQNYFSKKQHFNPNILSIPKRAEYRLKDNYSTRCFQLFKVDLTNFEEKSFKWKLIAQGRPIGRHRGSGIKSLIEISPEKISSRNACIINFEKFWTSQLLKNFFPDFDRIGILMNKSSPLGGTSTQGKVEEGSEGSQGSESSMKPLFAFYYDPNRDTHYQQFMKRKISEYQQQFEVLGRRASDRVKLNRTEHFNFWGVESHLQKFMAIVHTLSNYDMVLKVFDFSTKKMLKKSFLSHLEIVKKLGFRNKYHAYSVNIFQKILNPFDSTLYLSISATYHKFNPETEAWREQQREMEVLGSYYGPDPVENNPNFVYESRKYLMKISNIFDEKKRRYESTFYPCKTISLKLLKDSILIWRSNEGAPLEIEKFSLTGGKREKIVLNVKDRLIGAVSDIAELDEDKLILHSSQERVLVISREREAKIIDEKILSLSLKRKNNRFFSSYGNFLLKSSESGITLLRLSQTPSVDKKATKSSIEHVLDHQIAGRLSPKIGQILEVVDFQVLENTSICSLVLKIRYFPRESRLEFYDKFFHGLLDIKKNEILSWNLADAIPPEYFESRTKFTPKYFKFSLGSQGYLNCKSTKNEDIISWVKLSTSVENSNSSSGSSNPEATFPQPKLIEMRRTTGYSIKQENDQNFYFDYIYGENFYYVERRMGTSQKKGYKVLKVFNIEDVKLSEERLQDSVGISYLHIDIGKLEPAAVYCCREWKDKLTFERDS